MSIYRDPSKYTSFTDFWSFNDPTKCFNDITWVSMKRVMYYLRYVKKTNLHGNIVFGRHVEESNSSNIIQVTLYNNKLIHNLHHNCQITHNSLKTSKQNLEEMGNFFVKNTSPIYILFQY